MDTTPRVSTAAAAANLVLVLGCIATLGWLTARHMPLAPFWSFAVTFLLMVMGLIWLALLTGIVHVMNPEIAQSHGSGAALVPVATGMLMIVPFTVLALVAEFSLGWSATQAFAAAGLMTGAGGVGVEIGRLGPRKLLNSLVPAGGGALFVVIWMLLGAVVQGVSG
ncbi:MAG: hypothetical protein KKI08_14915 [Armatimonadetes bacterium]|nr:hypothetical protein [Armatimonadota bacterium]